VFLQATKKAQQGQFAVDLGCSGSYLYVMLRALFIILFIAAPALARSAQNGEISAARPAEYMIYQYPDISMVVKIDVPETEFESEIYGPENALVKSSGVPAGRIGPLYQYIDSVDIPRQLMIKVFPGRNVGRSRVKLELIQLPDRDRNSAAFAQAYQLFSTGTESVHGNDTTTWAMKTYTLKNAARAFASLGWEEMRLWSEYYAAHLVLHKLNDVLTAMEFAGEVQRSARRAGFDMIELAALILEGEAIMAAGASASGESAGARFENAHGIWDRVVLLAAELGLRSEQARALFNDGLAYEQQDRLEDAVRQFRQALEVSLSTDDTELVNEIRSTAAAVYETQGSTSGAIEMLEDIGSDLDNDAGQELSDTLYEKGRILNSNYRYPEASAQLDEALRLQKSNAALKPWGPTGLALAWSYYSMGDWERAAALILESIPRTPQVANADVLIRAYDSLAHIYRYQEQFRQMSLYREKHGDLIDSDSLRAGFLLESGIDAWRRDGPRSSQVRELLGQSRQLAVASGQDLVGHRAALYLCLLSIEQSGSGACTAAGARQSHAALSDSGIPRLVLDADFVKAKILHREGRGGEALALMEGLIEEILFLRQTLPGLLGAWYWQKKVEIFQEYMAITIGQSKRKTGKTSDGRRALLALDHIRLVSGEDHKDGQDTFTDGRHDEALRVLLSRREAATGPRGANLAARADEELQRHRTAFNPAVRPLDSASLDQLLTGLAPDEVLLSYYFSATADYALVGDRKGVSLVKLDRSGPVSDRLGRLREQLRRDAPSLLPDLDAMGRLLLGPVSGMLRQRILLLPAGALNGFPFDALRLDGQFLAENHRVVNMMNLAATANRRTVLRPDYREQVFLAGNPQAGQELFSYDIQASAEITALTDIFVGPGLHIVQGVALRKDEFQDLRFTRAGLIHLATPGTMDLAFPDRSRLQMSSAGDDQDTEDLSPQDLRASAFEAGLVVLSRTVAAAVSQSSFDNRLGFVSEFLDAGVSNVVASLWSGGDSETAAFMGEFYRELESARDVAEALSLARMRRMNSGDEANFRSWAGFQLYIR
jgi:CHAT domain-containing protein/tetratricopeptide (TPR) repeat protein